MSQSTKPATFVCAIAAILVSVVCTGTPAPQGTGVFVRLRAEHDRVLKQMNTQGEKEEPLVLDDDRVPALLRKGWTLAGEWAAEYLNNHAKPTGRQMTTIFDGFAPKPKGVKSQYGDFLEYPTYCFEGSLVRITPNVYVVQAHYFRDVSTGTFIVVARGGDRRFQPLWNIKDPAEKHYADRDEIGRWFHLTRRAYYNGPLDVKRILPVPPAANGHPRFLVDAFQSADGGTALAQLSVWEWTGADARPLFAKTYSYTWDQDSFHLEGNTLQLRTKEDLQSFFSCGGCPEPKGVWTVRMTPTGVTDLGHRFLQPELKWADDLLSKVAKGEDAGNIAKPEVVKTIKSAIQAAENELRKAGTPLDARGDFSWGMFDSFRRIGPGAFELSLDKARFTFSYMLRDGKPYFTKVSLD